jgi:transaldolase
MKTLADLRIRLFADGADKPQILSLCSSPWIGGFTTNPTLMRKAGVTDYEAFAKEILNAIQNLPVSFEVFADNFPGMERQARKIATWGRNVYVKVPITNTRREPSLPLIRHLTQDGIQVNVTALTTLEQVQCAMLALAGGAPSMISVFAGRIADTAVDPVRIMAKAVKLLEPHPQIQLIWASPRELLNIFQADAIGCHIITLTADILKKLDLVGKDLTDYSLETVRMFHEDAKAAGFSL